MLIKLGLVEQRHKAVLEVLGGLSLTEVAHRYGVTLKGAFIPIHAADRDKRTPQAFLDSRKIEQSAIVGHSFGSFVAQRVALDFPERVERLILVGSAASVGDKDASVKRVNESHNPS